MEDPSRLGGGEHCSIYVDIRASIRFTSLGVEGAAGLAGPRGGTLSIRDDVPVVARRVRCGPTAAAGPLRTRAASACGRGLRDRPHRRLRPDRRPSRHQRAGLARLRSPQNPTTGPRLWDRCRRRPWSHWLYGSARPGRV